MTTRRLVLASLLAFVLAIVGYSNVAEATIRRAPGAWQWGPTAVWTNNTTNDVFFALSDPMPASGLNNVRYVQELQNSTGNMQIKLALRYGTDGVNWDSPQAIAAAYVNANGVDAPGGYVDVVTGKNQKTYVQWGVFVRNINAGSNYEFGRATIQIEPKTAP
jgi:hypothetical protein